MNPFTAIAAATGIASLFKKNKAPDVPAPYQVPRYDKGQLSPVLRELMEETNYQGEQGMKTGMTQIDESMQRRGIGGSGIQSRYLGELLRQNQADRLAQNQGNALNLYQAWLNEHGINAGAATGNQNLAYQAAYQNYMNKQNQMSSMGNMLGFYLAQGGGGKTGGGTTSGGYGTPMGQYLDYGFA